MFFFLYMHALLVLAMQDAERGSSALRAQLQRAEAEASRARAELASGQDRSAAEAENRVREAEERCKRAEMERDDCKRKFTDMGKTT